MIRAIIVDDELDSISSTRLILEEFFKDKIKITGSFLDPKKALEEIKLNPPDLLLLDIDMPGMSGFELLKALPVCNFEVIFITAYNQFAIEAFNVHAADYILKPVFPERLIDTINKILNRIPQPKSKNEKYDQILCFLEGQFMRRISISSTEGVEYIPASDILYVEADEGYSYIFLKDRKITTTKKLNLLLEELGEACFYRCHRSFLVNIQHITKYSAKEGGYIQMTNNALIPLARRNKDEFLERMVKFSV
ncbi:MAG: response regulator transcription factor [Bacteroidia bacterium]|nr:response regulator transcription factor [Bacteroidia bacterium]